MSTGDTVLSLRPVFASLNVFAARLWLVCYVATMIGVAGSIGTSIYNHTGNGWPGLVIFSAIGLPIALFGILAVTKASYARTEYRFYADRLEFETGFFTVRRKTIMFRDVLEVSLQQSFLQRNHDIGTIFLSTLASDVAEPGLLSQFGLTDGTKSGASVMDIPRPDEAFAAVQKLIDSARSDRVRAA
jgi:membrane protein YdbS with pleckstrin-like domain